MAKAKVVPEEFLGYCMKCKKKRTVKEGRYRETARGGGILQGPCPRCETTVSLMTKAR